FFVSSRGRHTRCYRDWSSDVCSSDLVVIDLVLQRLNLHGNVTCQNNPVVRGEKLFQSCQVIFQNIHVPVYETCWIVELMGDARRDRKSTRLNSSHGSISYAVFCLKKK